MKRLSEKERKDVKVYALTVLFFCVAVLLHLIFYVLIHILEYDKAWSFDRFVKGDMQITKAPIVKNNRIARGNFYYIDVEYEYEFSGKRYRSSRVSFGNMSSGREDFYNSKNIDEMKNIEASILKDRNVYFDPNDPSYSVLIPKSSYKNTHMKKNIWYAVDVGAICAAIASLLMFYVMVIVENGCKKAGREMSSNLFFLPILGVFFLAAILSYLLIMVY